MQHWRNEPEAEAPPRPTSRLPVCAHHTFPSCTPLTTLRPSASQRMPRYRYSSPHAFSIRPVNVPLRTWTATGAAQQQVQHLTNNTHSST